MPSWIWRDTRALLRTRLLASRPVCSEPRLSPHSHSGDGGFVASLSFTCALSTYGNTALRSPLIPTCRHNHLREPAGECRCSSGGASFNSAPNGGWLNDRIGRQRYRPEIAVDDAGKRDLLCFKTNATCYAIAGVMKSISCINDACTINDRR